MSTHSIKRSIRYKSLDFLGFPKYRVGDDGSVWSHHFSGQWIQMSPGSARGHLQVTFCHQGKHKHFFVHRLVLSAFRGLPPENMMGCHNDGNRKNNQLKNLRWDTLVNNQRDRFLHGTSLCGERNPGSKLTIAQVKEIRRLYKAGKFFQKDLAEKFKVCKQTINNIVHEKQWLYSAMNPTLIRISPEKPPQRRTIVSEGPDDPKSKITYKRHPRLGNGYLVGNNGTIWTSKKKQGIWMEMRLAVTKTGHLMAGLHKDGIAFSCWVHRLVLEAFVGPCPEGMEACHNNGIANDNRLENLRWDTSKNNCRDRGNYGVAKLTEKEVLEIRQLYSTGKYTMQFLANSFAVSLATVYSVIRRKTWQSVE